MKHPPKPERPKERKSEKKLRLRILLPLLPLPRLSRGSFDPHSFLVLSFFASPPTTHRLARWRRYDGTAGLPSIPPYHSVVKSWGTRHGPELEYRACSCGRIQNMRSRHGLQPACLCGLYSSVFSSFSAFPSTSMTKLPVGASYSHLFTSSMTFFARSSPSPMTSITRSLFTMSAAVSCIYSALHRLD